jgi:transposase
MRRSKELSPRQVTAIAHLLAGKTIEATATEVGVSQQAVDSWLRKAEFREELNRGKDAIYDAAVTKLTRLATKALDNLEAVLDSPTTPPNVRVQASKVVIDNVPKYRAIDLGERLERIEAMLADNDDAP